MGMSNVRQLKSIVYNKNYKSKIIIVLLISVILGFIGYYKNVFIFEYPQMPTIIT